ncbi:MAG: MASE1 domain-containing protein [Limisphaerales bacterium]
MNGRKLSTFTRVVILTAFYCVGGMLGEASSFMSGRVALVWPQSGIALAAILLFGYRFWPGVALGAVLFDVWNGTAPSLFTLGTAIGSTVGALLCTYLLERFVKFRPSMERVHDVAGLVVLACLLGTTVNASFNVVSLCYQGRGSWDALFPAMLSWWVPNAMAGLVVTPFILTWGSPSFIRWRPKRVMEAGLCAIGLLAGTLISFNSWYVYGLQNYPLAYLPYPFLVWGALRFGPRGATTGTLLVSAVAIHALLQMRGPFVTRLESESLMLIGSYIGILAVSNLLLAAAAMEHRRAEEALAQSEERFSKAFHASPIAIGIATLDDQRFVDVNGQFLRMLGYGREEVIGHTDLELPIWVNLGQRAQLLESVREGRNPRDLEAQLRSRSGETLTVLTSVESINLASQPCLLFILHDITERQSLEAQLRQLQKMEAIGQLSAGVAHDFNNILTVIQGYTKLVAGERHLEPKTVEALDLVMAAADRASLLTRQLLTFSRRQATHPQKLNVNELVEDTAAMLGRILGEDIALSFDCEPQLSMVVADSGMIEQVLLNLAVNSRDAMPRGGKLTIRTAELHIDDAYAKLHPESRSGTFVKLAVADTGCGIAPENLPRVFEPFFTTKEVGKGTGLGLATVFGIVKQHLGWITVASTPGLGTTFEILLPSTGEKPTPSLEKPAEPRARGGTETILLVEDEEAVRGLARVVLQRHGYRVLEAGSGSRALAVWNEHASDIDLLLTDMVMPEGMSGRELAEELLANRSDLKIIYTSGYSEDMFEKSLSLEEGFNFLRKPFYPQKLAQTVRDCLDR